VLMADYIYSRAITLLVEAELTQVLSLLAWTVHKMSIGELLQLELKDRGPLDKEAYFTVIYEKTARLIEGSCRTGAILGGRGAAEVEALGTFGRSMGMAFQIVDDILDYQADPDVLGKPVVKHRQEMLAGEQRVRQLVIVASDTCRERLPRCGQLGFHDRRVLFTHGGYLTTGAPLGRGPPN
jgi:octaprenyl-diphosphate synthase